MNDPTKAAGSAVPRWALMLVSLMLMLPLGTRPQAAAQSAPLSVSSDRPPTATSGAPYQFTFTAAGGAPPYNWTVTVVGPDWLDFGTNGLAINSSTGVFSGTPFFTGMIPIIVEVQDANFDLVSVQYDLNVAGAGSPRAITNSPPSGTQGSAYSFRFATTWTPTLGCDASLFFIEGDLPPGLTLNILSGDLGQAPAPSGTPINSGRYSFTVSGAQTTACVANPTDTNSHTFTVPVNPGFSSTAPAGAENWIRQRPAPVLSPSISGWDSLQLRSPSVIKNGALFLMYYEAEDSGTHTSRIGLATSSNGASWSKFGVAPLLSPGGAGAWDAFEVRYPSVHFDGALFRMWYWGRAARTEGGKIGLATSTDGINWTKQPVPVFGASFGGQGFIPGSVVRVNGLFTMWYTTPAGAIGRATSPDGVSWTDTGVVVDMSPRIFARPAVILDGATYRMWFTKRELGQNGGFAGNVSDISTRNIGYATSPNGINWTVYSAAVSLCSFCIAGDSVVTVFGIGQSGAWDRPGVGQPAVLKDGAVFKMWYTGGRLNRPQFGATQGSVPFVEGAIGYAATTAPSALAAVDFDSDGKSDVGIYRDGLWAIIRSSGGGNIVDSLGGTSHVPVPADYDGDGKADIAVYLPANGVWSIKRSSDGAITSVGFGGPAFTPVPADYDGDGKADIAVFSGGVWSILRSSDGGNTVIAHGGPGWTPVPGDYDGDGKADVAVYINGAWSIKRSSDSVIAVSGHGGPTWTPVPGDYDGDGKTDIAVYTVGAWSILRSSDSGNTVVGHGGPTWEPVAADYDGDGKTDIAVHLSGAWAIINSTTSSISVVGHGGGPTDVPLN